MYPLALWFFTIIQQPQHFTNSCLYLRNSLPNFGHHCWYFVNHLIGLQFCWKQLYIFHTPLCIFCKKLCIFQKQLYILHKPLCIYYIANRSEYFRNSAQNSQTNRPKQVPNHKPYAKINCGISVRFRYSNMGWPAIGPQVIWQETLRTLGSETSTSVGPSEI